MTYAELVKYFWQESGLAINEYAELIGFSTPSVSMVLNERQPGSIKMIQACAINAGKNIQDYLWVIESAAEESEKKALRAVPQK